MLTEGDTQSKSDIAFGINTQWTSLNTDPIRTSKPFTVHTI
jgi:hypothetical protein